MASRLFQFIFRSRPAAHIVPWGPGGVGKTGDKGAAGRAGCRLQGQSAAAAHHRLLIGIIEGLLADGDGPYFGRARRTVQLDGIFAGSIPGIPDGNCALGPVQSHLVGGIAAQGHRIIQLHRGGPHIGAGIRRRGHSDILVPSGNVLGLGYPDDIVDVSPIGTRIASGSHVGDLVAPHGDLAARKDHIIAGPGAVRMGDGQAAGIDFCIPHGQGTGAGEIHVLGQLDLQGAVRSVDSDVAIGEFGAVRSPQDIQFFAEILGKSGGSMVIPAEFQIRGIGGAVDGEALHFRGGGRSGGGIGRHFGPGGEDLGHRGSIGGVGQGDRGILTASAAPAGDGDGPIHRLGRAAAVPHGRDGQAGIGRIAALSQIHRLDVIVVQSHIIILQGFQVFVIVRYPVSAHRSIGVRYRRRPIAVIFPVFHGRHENFVVGAVHRSCIDFRPVIGGEHPQFAPDHIQMGGIHCMAIVGVLVQGPIPHQLGIGIGGGHKAQRGPGGAGRTVVHIRIAVLVIGTGGSVGLGMPLPGRIVDDIVPVPRHLGPSPLAQAFKGAGGDLVQGFPRIGRDPGGRNSRSGAGQDVRRLFPAACIGHIEFAVRPRQGGVFLRRPFRQGIPIPDPVLGLAIGKGHLMVNGSIEGVGVPAVVVALHIPVIHGDPKGYILVLGSICHGGFSGSFRRQHLARKGQEA